MPIYVKYGAIDGDVTAAGHEKWIEINSAQFGVGRGISSPTGGSADREASAPSVSEIVVTKPTDVASTKLFNEALQGEGTDVTIDFCKTDKGKLETYMTYTLTNTMVSSFSMSSGGDRPMESLSFNYTKIEFKNTAMGAANDTGSPDAVTYDLALGTVA
jgi:type VI secretion system secreted protein Hcp